MIGGNALATAVLAALMTACATVNSRDAAVDPVFDHDIRPLLESHCGRCHGAERPAAEWHASRFTDAIACLPDQASANPPGSRLTRALARADHQGFLDAAQLASVRAWLATGAAASRGAMHDPGFADPRSPSFHAAVLRATRWAPMLDATRADACGRCHDGVPARPDGVTERNAPSCTSCHDRPGGVLACTTCHGSGDRPWARRDPCLHPNAASSAGAHAAHVLPSGLQANPLACATCHPARSTDVGSGPHGDGVVDVVFDPARAGATATYDPATQQCSVQCHARGGQRPRPAWTESVPMRCGDCHASPPANHPPGACTTCHDEPDAAGASLIPGALHLNGRVDLGNASGTCGACHGRSNGESGWPASGAHQAHRAPTAGADVACGDCHLVPDRVDAPGHLDGTPGAEVRLSGRAAARGTHPAFAAGGCSDVACHGAGLPGVTPPAVQWIDASGGPRRCGACHAVPPPAPHPVQNNCESLLCHGGEVTPSPSGPQITVGERALHQNGAIDLWDAGR